MNNRHAQRASAAPLSVYIASLACLVGYGPGCTHDPDAADIAVMECRPQTRDNAIVNGEMTGHQSFGEVGTLFGVGVTATYPEPAPSGLCSATLIAPDVVVTAAHCVGGFPWHRIRISTHPCPGPNDVENIADLKYVAMHPDWHVNGPTCLQNAAQAEDANRIEQICERRAGHDVPAKYWSCIDEVAPNFFARTGLIDGGMGDIAVAILNKPLQIAPLAYLPSVVDNDAHIQIGSRLTAVGYGVSGRKYDGQLAAGDRYSGRVLIDEIGQEEMRINFATARICNGDSGGPLLQQTPLGRVLLGVGVRGYPSAVQHRDLCDGPSIATQVHPYTPWIRQTIRDACRTGQRSHQMCAEYPI